MLPFTLQSLVTHQFKLYLFFKSIGAREFTQ